MPRKNRKIAPAAAPVVSPVAVAAAALAAVVAPDTMNVSGTLAALDPFTVAPGDMNPATPPHRRTIGTIAAGDRPGDAVRTLSLSARFAALSVDPAPLMLDGAFLNVTQPAMSVSAPLLDGDALGYVSRPYTATRAALTVALALLDAALSVPLSGTVIPSGPLFTALTVVRPACGPPVTSTEPAFRRSTSPRARPAPRCASPVATSPVAARVTLSPRPSPRTARRSRPVSPRCRPNAPQTMPPPARSPVTRRCGGDPPPPQTVRRQHRQRTVCVFFVPGVSQYEAVIFRVI